MHFLKVNVARSCVCSYPRKMLESIDRSFGLWIGEMETTLSPLKTCALTRNCSVQHVAEIAPGLNHFGLLNIIHSQIGNWIMSLEFVKLCSKMTSFNLADDLSKDELNGMKNIQHPILKDAGTIKYSYHVLNLNKVKIQYLAASDNARIGYRLFMPDTKPFATLILLQSEFKVLLGYILSKKYELAVYCVDIRGVDTLVEVSQKESVLMDVKTVIRHVKNNSPDVPVILGGHGIGASVSLNYAFWKSREPVNGFVFVSPLVDRRSSSSSDQAVIKASNLDKLYSLQQSNWFYGGKTYAKQASKLQEDFAPRQFSNVMWDVAFARDFFWKMKDLDSPFGLWIGAEDELMKAESLVSSLSKLRLSSISMAQLIPHSSHLGTLITSTAFIIPWVKRLVKIITPSLSFRLTASRLEDFEKLQFIGKGSFGRVYLVRHIASNQYFAMKGMRIPKCILVSV